MVSLHDVAAVAGVSVMTVSNVLNGKPSVNPELRDRVRAAVTSTGYIANEAARTLRAGSSRVIGVLALEAVNPFYGELVAGVERALEGTDILVVAASSHAKIRNELAALRRFAELRVQGAVVTASTWSPELRAAIAALTAAGTPVVAIANPGDDLDLCTVSGDDAQGGRLAADHLTSLPVSRLAYVGAASTSTVHQRRRDSFLDGVVGRGLPEPVLIDTGGDSLGDGLIGGRRLLAGAPECQAVFCSNDLLALGVLQAATEAGIRVPDDIAVLGYDDIPFAAGAAIPLSSLGQDTRAMGERAAELLRDETGDGEHVHQHVTFPPSVVPRRSTQRP